MGARRAVLLGDAAISAAYRLAVVAVCLQTASHLIDVFAFDLEVESLSADSDIGVWAWASSAATLTAGLGALLLAFARRPVDRWVLLLAGILVFFSMDDVAALHEKLGTAVRDQLGLPSGFGRLTWPALFLPLLATSFVLLLRLAESAFPRARTAIRLGLALLVAAVLAEMATAPFYAAGEEGTSPGAALEVVVEEGAELAAWLVIGAALAALALRALDGEGPGEPDRRPPAKETARR